LFGGVNKFSWGQRADRTGIWGRWHASQGFRSIRKWVNPVFLLGCYGCIFHGTGNSARISQNVGIRGGGFDPPPPPGTSLLTWIWTDEFEQETMTKLYYIYIYWTAVGLTPGGSST
jgi:hypothetical protein